MGLEHFGEESFPRDKGKRKEEAHGLVHDGQDDGTSHSFREDHAENVEINSVLFESTMRAMPQYMESLFKTIDPLVFLLKTRVKNDTSRDAVLLKSSEDIKNSAVQLAYKIEKLLIPQMSTSKDSYKDLYSHVEKSKEVLIELSKCWISYEEVLAKNLSSFHETLNKNYATLEEQISDKVVDVTSLCLETIQQLNTRGEQMYSLVREIKTQNIQRFESLDSKFNNLIHLLQEKNERPQRVEEEEIPPRDNTYTSVPRDSPDRQSSRRPRPMDRNMSGFAKQDIPPPNNFKREGSSNHSTKMALTNEDLFKFLKKDIPALKDWPRFTGEGE